MPVLPDAMEEVGLPPPALRAAAAREEEERAPARGVLGPPVVPVVEEVGRLPLTGVS